MRTEKQIKAAEVRRTKAILRMLKNMPNSRPVLKTVDIQDGKLYGTNAYLAFVLNNDIKELPHCDEKVGHYPEMKRIVDPVRQHLEYDHEQSDIHDLDLDILSSEIKNKSLYVKFGGGYFTAKLLKLLCDIADQSENFVVYKAGESSGFPYYHCGVLNEDGIFFLLGFRLEAVNTTQERIIDVTLFK